MRPLKTTNSRRTSTVYQTGSPPVHSTGNRNLDGLGLVRKRPPCAVRRRAGAVYSMIQSTCRISTFSPCLTFIWQMTPAVLAVRSFCIFMASRIITVSPAST